MPASRANAKRKKGFALLYVTLTSAFVLIPMAGLAVDFGILYNVKARLQTAADAAATGAGSQLHAATDLGDSNQVSAIKTTAQNYFNANYPAHYFGSTVSSYTASLASTTAGKTITVNATATIPTLLLRVLGIQGSQVSAMAVANVRFVSMMIAVDRSGSVGAEGAAPTIQSALSTFVATSSTSALVDGVDTVGMVSFGGAWKLDYTPTTNFQTASPSIQNAINNIPFDSQNSTNTAEGLYQAWTQLYQANLPGALNVIVLLTDGRPSAFTGNFTPAPTSLCLNKTARGGVLETFVSLGSYPFWPPPTSPNETNGLYATQFTTTPETGYFAPNSLLCAYSLVPSSVGADFGGVIPTSVGPVDRVGSSWNPAYTNAAGTGISTQTGYYANPDTSMSNPRTMRYAAFNVADNMATLIRQDTTLNPMLFVIGLNYTNNATEPLDEDWLAHLANDPSYVTVGSDPSAVAAGRSVYQTGQTAGLYCNSTTSTLSACFSEVSSKILRLVQ